jgi:hypothetical protein
VDSTRCGLDKTLTLWEKEEEEEEEEQDYY